MCIVEVERDLPIRHGQLDELCCGGSFEVKVLVSSLFINTDPGQLFVDCS